MKAREAMVMTAATEVAQATVAPATEALTIPDTVEIVTVNVFEIFIL